jgi:hypothetical protein
VSDDIETIEIHGESSVDWQATAMRYMELNKEKVEVITRLRKLHRPVREDGAPQHCREDLFWYPCDTIKLLDGNI